MKQVDEVTYGKRMLQRKNEKNRTLKVFQSDAKRKIPQTIYRFEGFCIVVPTGKISNQFMEDLRLLQRLKGLCGL